MPSDFALVSDECGTFCFLKGSKSFLQERSRFLSCVAANWTTKLLGDSVGLRRVDVDVDVEGEVSAGVGVDANADVVVAEASLKIMMV